MRRVLIGNSETFKLFHVIESLLLFLDYEDVTYFKGLAYCRFDYSNTKVLAVDYDGISYEVHVKCCTGNAVHADGLHSKENPHRSFVIFSEAIQYK